MQFPEGLENTPFKFQGFKISKKNRCRGNYMSKCGILKMWKKNKKAS